MSVTSSRPADLPVLGLRLPRVRLRGLGGLGVDLALLVFCLVCVLAMWLDPELATVPYHFIFLSVMLVYGFRVWSLPVTAAALLAVVVVTTVLMVHFFAEGLLEAPELSELALMPALLVAMVWHARRREAATRSLEQMAEVQRAMIEQQRQFFRDTSHAIRTPVTIARGHLEIATDIPGSDVEDHVAVARRQLTRMTMLSNRLLALAQLDAGERPPTEVLSLSRCLGDVVDTWGSDPRRTWRVSCEPGAYVEAEPEWLTLALEALIENAVHFTEEGTTITIAGSVDDVWCRIAVADEGVGIPEPERGLVFERFWHRKPPSGPMGSGLGLPIARATVQSWGGDIEVSGNDAGGATFTVRLPRAELATP